MNALASRTGLTVTAIGDGMVRPAFDICARRHGGQTFLSRQFVTYPFHLTRVFRLDPALPEVATLYMQSSSGGLYAGEDHALAIHVSEGAALHLTTQGSTIVQGHQGRTARMRITITVESGGFLAYTPDPQILFPGAASDTLVTLDLAKDAVAVLSDGFLLHDPRGEGAAPVSFRSVVETSVGRQLVFVDRQKIAGTALAAADGPLRGRGVAGSLLAFGLGVGDLPASMAASLARPGVLAATTALPDECGIGARLLAQDGAAFQGAIAAGFTTAFAGRFGTAPAARRK